MSSFFNQAKIINVYYNKGDRKPYNINGKPIAYIGEESIGATEATTLRFYLGENIDSSTAIIVTKRADGERRIDICLKVENGVDSYYEVTLNSWYSQVKGKATLVFKVYNGTVTFDSTEMPTEILSVEGRIIVSDIFNLEIAYAPDSDFVVPPDDVPEYAQWFLALSQKLDKVDSITVDIALPEPLTNNTYNNRYFFIQNEGVGKLFYIDGNEPIEVVWGVGTIQLTPSGNGDVVTGLEAGKLYWSEDRGTIIGGLYDDQVVGIGDGFFWFVKVKVGEANIAKGDVVQFAGNVGGQIVVKKAVFAEITAQPDLLMGVAKHNIIAGNKGYIVAIGRLDNINTSGDNFSITQPILYLSTTTPGQLTSTKPTNGFKGSIAAIGRASTEGGSNGFLLVRPNFIKGINEATDVLITSLTNKDILRWDSTSGRWENNADLTDLETNLQDYKDDIADGTIIVGKAENDKDGNEFDATYLKKTTASSTYLTQANASSTYLTQANATAIYIPLSQKSIPNGVATLGTDGRVLPSQLPGSIGEVLEYPTLLDFPEEGAAEKIFIAADTNLTYRWSGTQYVEISQSLALGETTETAFQGSRGVALETLTTNIVNGTQGLTDTRITNSATTIQPLIVNGVVNTTADLLRLQVGSVNALEVTKDGIVNKSVANSVIITQNDLPILSTFKHPTGSTAVPTGNNTFVGLSGNTTMGSTATLTSQASLNTAVGHNSFISNTTGSNNVALGANSLTANTTGGSNSAVGENSLASNSGGVVNSALGLNALNSNTTGNNNTAVGGNSLRFNTTGSSNTGVGLSAGRFIANGTTSNTTGSNSVFLGSDTKALANGQTNQIVIGHNATGIGSNTVVLGNDDIVTTALKGNITLAGADRTIINTSNNALSLGTNNLTRLTIASGGNVGIGTSVPQRLLSLLTSTNDDGIQIRRNSLTTNDYATLGFRISTTNDITNFAEIRAIRTSRVVGTDTDLSFQVVSNSALTERLRIRDDGKVGIGTSAPNSLLSLVTEASTDGIQIRRNSVAASAYALLGFRVSGIEGSSFAEIRATRTNRAVSADTDLSFHTYSNSTVSERLRIRDDGNVGIGTTSPSTKLHINGNLRVDGNIQFPATQVASSDANNLDDYEEGDWTPVLGTTGDAPTVTYVTQTGKYTKIGNIVNVQCYIRATVSNVGTGTPEITGLPFSAFSMLSGVSIGLQNIFATQLPASFSNGYIDGTKVDFSSTSYSTSSNVYITFSATYRVA
jgi:hypothetical protein